MKKSSIVFISMVITLTLLIPYSSFKNQKIKKQVQQNKYIASQRLNDLSQKLVGILNQSFEYVEMLELILEVNKDNPELMEKYAQMILEKNDTIKNIAIAPDGIIQMIYPEEQNKEAIGHNLMVDPERYPFIKKAIDEDVATIQGPVKAIQGGVLIFNRKPIFITENQVERFWGLLIISVDFEKIIEHFDIDTGDFEYYLALKAKESNGFDDFIWGDTECYTEDSIKNTIHFENQEWELAIYPKQGWEDYGEHLFVLEATDILYLFLSFILFLFIVWHLNQYSKNLLKAKTDVMTGALNKNAFRKLVIKNLKNRKNKIQAMIVIDMNDFKSINDTYGHLVGDAVIIEISKRFKKILGSNDLLARWGGDEFAIYIDHLEVIEEIRTIVKRINHEVETPIEVREILIEAKIALGYALYPKDGINFEELYKRADAMMYANKPLK